MKATKEDIERSADRMCSKYDIPREMYIRLAKEGLESGLSLKAIEITWRMHAGTGKELFSIEDMMEVTGASREELVETIESTGMVEQGLAFQTLGRLN